MRITGVQVDTEESTVHLIAKMEPADTLGDVLRIANAVEAKPMAGRPDEERLALALETIGELRKAMDGINAYASNMESLYMELRGALHIDIEVEPVKALAMASNIEGESRRHSFAAGEADVARLTSALAERDTTCAKATGELRYADEKIKQMGEVIAQMTASLDARDAFHGAVAKAVGLKPISAPSAILGAVERVVAERDRMAGELTTAREHADADAWKRLNGENNSLRIKLSVTEQRLAEAGKTMSTMVARQVYDGLELERDTYRTEAEELRSAKRGGIPGHDSSRLARATGEEPPTGKGGIDG